MHEYKIILYFSGEFSYCELKYIIFNIKSTDEVLVDEINRFLDIMYQKYIKYKVTSKTSKLDGPGMAHRNVKQLRNNNLENFYV